MKENKETDTEDLEDIPVLCSQRWILAYIGFLGFGVVYSLRVNISVAVVCMLKPTHSSAEVDLNITNFTTAIPTHVACIEEMKAASHSSDRAELEWNPETKSSILASFFYGYIFTQIPGGWIADRYGGKRVLFVTILLSSILTVLMPVCARTSVYLVYTIRVLIGLLTSTNFPAMNAMWGRWAPKLERSKLATLCYAGTTLGNVLTFSTSGLLCAYGFDNGWGSIFYVTGILGILWSLAWFYITADTPASHPRINAQEIKYITRNVEFDTEKRSASVPWLSIVKSPRIWACLTGHVCNNWTNYTLLTNIPTFMKEVLKFDIKANGGLSAVPYICMFFSTVIAGQIADLLRSRKILSTTVTRKIFLSFGFAGAGGCLAATGFCDCEHRTLAVGLLSLAVMFTGVSRSGYGVNHVDLAPKFAGVLYGITNTFATIPGMTAPLLAGYLTPNNTPEEWRNVFYVCAGFDAFGILIFCIFGSGEMQDWAKDEIIEVEIPVDKLKGNSSLEKDSSVTSEENKVTSELPDNNVNL
ncbi:uncharacterized transporter slc-17.2-like [Ruditapes philippinarum]|uniref:uncharacterized transporter slc-17.2-like n=1 Tax=Ruditapes philippinarum TaxID=129788 RepID=UPI00295C1153|nr:uncharacterized transporter slc-17.2-like [Ruditapes philippinarum]